MLTFPSIFFWGCRCVHGAAGAVGCHAAWWGGGGGNGVLRTWENLLTHGTHNVGLWKIHSNTPTAWRPLRDLHVSYINTQETYVKRRHMWTQEDAHLVFTSTCKGCTFRHGFVPKSLRKRLIHSFLRWKPDCHKWQARAMHHIPHIAFYVVWISWLIIMFNLYQPQLSLYLVKIMNTYLFSGLICLIRNLTMVTYKY